MKKLINTTSDVVTEAIAGFVGAHEDLVKAGEGGGFVIAKHAPVPGKVGIVSGGGSGHEPLHAGYVGRGMLDAAVPGAIFTSPTPDPILAATRACDAGAGVLYIVKNYTGDVLNFETAAELAEAEGLHTATVIVNDDVAVENSLFTAGRRGVAGTVLVEKLAGAAAERGDDLAGVSEIATRAIERVRSMGVALSAPIVPHAGVPSFELAENEIELGIGIHGEPGRRRVAMQDANSITDLLLDAVVKDLGLGGGARVLLMVNGMGGTPLAEMYIVYAHARARLEKMGVTVSRSLVGNYATSLEMQGVSITLLQFDDELLELWDEPVSTPTLSWGAH